MNIREAKAKVLNKQPFLGSLLYTLPIEETDRISTLAVDGETLFVNPEFWNKHTTKEQYGLLMHEAGHLFLNHLWRGRNYKEIVINPQTGEMASLFSIAGDYVINLMIDSDNNFALPKGCRLDKKYTGMATEEVYADLLKTTPKMTDKELQQMIDSGVCDKSMWGKFQGKKAKEQEKKWKERVKEAIEYSRAQGVDPDWMKRLYKDMQPKEDWRILLREYAQPYAGDFTFSPVDRRFLDGDFLLPDIQDNEQIDWIAIAIDTSGSIGDKELSAFLGEVRGILDSYDRVKVKITFCDAQATPFMELSDFDKDKIEATGGGGTDFRPVFDLIKKEDTPPKCLLYFTDTYGTFPNKAPDYDVMWVIIDNGQAPWGNNIKL